MTKTDDAKDTNKDAFAKDLLIADHKYIGELLQKNEQGGETRVNIFISLVTAGIAGLFAMISKQELEAVELRVAIISGLVFLLVVGCVTWLRMIKRDVATDRFKRQLDMIRATFKQHCAGIAALEHYDLFPKSFWSSTRNFGGLADTVAVLNGFLAAGIAAALTFPCELPLTFISDISASAGWAAVAGMAVAVGQVTCANYVERKAKPRSLAGGVVYRISEGEVEYLLVSPTKGGKERVLPKGHVEPGEDQSETALREVKEEAGVVAEIVGFIDRVQFQKDGEAQEVAFYLMKETGVVAPKEKRIVDWFSLDAALARLDYDESKFVIRVADRLLRKISIPQPAPTRQTPR